MRGYQVREGANEPRVTVPLNDNIDYEGGVVTWIDNLAGERPYGNDLDPTLNLDILEVSFPQPDALEDPGDAAAAGDGASHHRLPAAAGGKRRVQPIRARTSIICRSSTAPISAAAMPRSWRCPTAARRAIDPDGAFEFIRGKVLAYVEDELIAREMNAFDAALALMALAHLGADVSTFAPALHCIVSPARRRRPARAVQGL